jgi:flagellar protein FlaG
MFMQIETTSISTSNPTSLSKEGLASGNPVPLNGSDPEKEEKSVVLPELQVMADDLQNNLKLTHDVNVKFSVHQASGQVLVAVTDEDTGEIIRQIPSEEMVKLSMNLEEMMGLIFDQKI